jgi:hypothetical protein
MKRKRTNGDVGDHLRAHVVFPPLESTVLIESGGSTGFNASNFSSEISSALGGVQRIQYNDPFWCDDFFSTTRQNTVCGLIYSIYSNGGFSTSCFPLCLPRQMLSTNLNKEEGLPNQERFFKMQKSVAYGLNLLFSKPGVILSTLNGFSEWVSVGGNPAIDTIVNTTGEPPLLFDIIHQTGQLSLHVNPTYPKRYEDFQIVFNLITIPKDWERALQGNYNILGDSSGWFGLGPYLFGYGQLDTTRHQYYDEVHNEADPNLFLANLLLLMRPPSSPTVGNTSNWMSTAVLPFHLKFWFYVSELTCALVGSRYFSIQSNQLSRLQLRPPVYNTSPNMNSAICFLHNDIDNSGIFQSGLSSFISKIAIHYDPRQSHNEVDIAFLDEWGNIASSFEGVSSTEQALYENSDDPPEAVPAAYQAYDPYFATNAPNHDCLFPYFKINQNMFIYTDVEEVDLSKQYTSKPSTSITHFLRVIGS